jgi:hypothetical protein
VNINLIKEFQCTIEGREHTINLTVEYDKRQSTFLYVSAIADTGFNLCGHDAYFKDYIPMNSKVRAEKSIANHMLDVLDNFETSIREHTDGIVLAHKSIKVNINGTEVYGSPLLGMPFFSACNIKSAKSGECVSWYEHNIFKQGDIQLEVYRQTNGQLRIEAKEEELYDFTKLRALYDSESFQKSKFAFFFYNEVRRLLGMPINGDLKRMSGLGPGV